MCRQGGVGFGDSYFNYQLCFESCKVLFLNYQICSLFLLELLQTCSFYQVQIGMGLRGWDIVLSLIANPENSNATLLKFCIPNIFGYGTTFIESETTTISSNQNQMDLLPHEFGNHTKFHKHSINLRQNNITLFLKQRTLKKKVALNSTPSTHIMSSFKMAIQYQVHYATLLW